MNDENIINEENSKSKESINSENPNIVRDENSITDHFDTVPFAEDDIDEPEVTYVESTEDGEALPTKDVAKKLREDLKICRQEKEEYLTGWQRAKADYINLQKELDLARINISVISREKMTEKLLPSLDSFEMAFSNKEHWEKIDKDWQNGITSIYQQLLTGLAHSGIEKIDKVDVPFDPNIHQSISTTETTDQAKDHTVEKVLQMGYKIGERIIRPAKVTIYEIKNK